MSMLQVECEEMAIRLRDTQIVVRLLHSEPLQSF